MDDVITNEEWARRRVLVTGASGFIGSSLVRQLVDEKAEIIAVVRSTSSTARLDDIADRIILKRLDLAGDIMKTWKRSLNDVDTVYHLAAAGVDPGFTEVFEMVHANVLGTTQLLEAAASAGVRRFVYTGSCFEYGEGEHHREQGPFAPTSAYAASKASGGLMVSACSKALGIEAVILRLFTVYGPSEALNRLIPFTILKALAGEVIPLTGGAQSRDFVYIDDVVDALKAAGTREVAGAVINVCSGVETPVRSVVETILDEVGGSAIPEFGALRYRPTEMWHLSGDPSLARQLLGWASKTPLREGIRRTVDWVTRSKEAATQRGRFAR